MIWAFSEATSDCLVCELRRGAFRQGIQDLVLQSNAWACGDAVREQRLRDDLRRSECLSG